MAKGSESDTDVAERTEKLMVRQIIVAAVVLAAVLLGGAGCMQNNPKQNINTAALAYMEQKYGEKFEYVKPWGSMASGNDKRQIIVSCASLPGEEILVVISGSGKKESYADNYMDIYFKPQTAEYIKQIADNFFDVVSVETDANKDYIGTIQKAIDADSSIGKVAILKTSKASDYNSPMAAVCFEDAGNIYVQYKGTPDGGWVQNPISYGAAYRCLRVG